ncbi:branched-chain amino acid aminotransferase [Aureispira anguillae]|uniref:Branched-chain-amino-acid aminotransferase n=1 Tax=Aureispira anguillae TaxID=2864201 RepID=A0A916DRU4_9BACT|nr:branched-chain amino acid aminotransferase [Aureispira anguillae]BDS10632.1 branched-chain amino acid aminotransferase [Aureispira anguillae]
MKYPVKVQLAEKSRREGLDIDNLPFGKTFSDHMFVADYKDGAWQNCQLIPYGDISFAPSMMALHYGQSVFEGMKANISTQTGEPVLFRAKKHAQRFNRSSERLRMPAVPEELFLEAVNSLTLIDKEWIPKTAGSALYIRPFIFASDESLGVRASTSYKFIVFTGPVGPYYPKPVRILVAQKYVRAFPGGMGFAKAAGNYAATLKPAEIAKEEGFDQILWLDGLEFKYLQECGTMNIFAVIGDTVLTPPTTDSILDGVTRDSIIHLLKEKGINIEVRPIEIQELIDAHKAGELKEMFGSGTAAVVSHVADISYQNVVYSLPAIEDRKIGPMIKKALTDIKENTVEETNGWVTPAVSTILEKV